MDKVEIKNMLLHDIPVYIELHNDLICINDISVVSRYDCWIGDKPAVRYHVYIRRAEKANPISITPEDYEILKTYLTII